MANRKSRLDRDALSLRICRIRYSVAVSGSPRSGGETMDADYLINPHRMFPRPGAGAQKRGRRNVPGKSFHCSPARERGPRNEGGETFLANHSTMSQRRLKFSLTAAFFALVAGIGLSAVPLASASDPVEDAKASTRAAPTCGRFSVRPGFPFRRSRPRASSPWMTGPGRTATKSIRRISRPTLLPERRRR